MQEMPGKEGIAIFVSPKRKRVLSPHNCAKISKEYPLTHIPTHREVYSNIEDGSELRRTIEPSDDPRFDLAWTVGEHSPETTTFLRRHKSSDDDYLGFGSTQKRDIFGKLDNSYSSDEEKDTLSLKQEPQLPKKYEETKHPGKCGQRCLDGDGEGDAGTESDFSGVAGKMSTLSVGKRPSSFAAFSRKASPGCSPSSQNSSLNSSLALSPSGSLCPALKSQNGMDYHICAEADPRKWNRRSSAGDPFASKYEITAHQRREKTNKFISSGSFNINGPTTPSLDNDSSNNTYLSDFHKSANTSRNTFNHTTYTDALYNASFHSNLHNELHDSASGPKSNRSPPSSSSGSRIWRHALGSVAGTEADDPHTPFTPFIEDSPSNNSNIRVCVPKKIKGSADELELDMPLDVRESPVLTPNRKRQPSLSNAQSQSMTLSQQSHEEAMGDLGTPVTEVGSPAVLDDLDDLQEDEETGEENGERSPSGRVLFGGCGSLFQDEEDENDGKFTRDLSGGVRLNEIDCDDPEMVMIASNAGTTHTWNVLCTNDNAQKCLPPQQLIRTFSPFVGEKSDGKDVVQVDDNDYSHENSVVCDDDLEYHLFAQQFMSSPSRKDVGEAVLPKSGAGRYEHTSQHRGRYIDNIHSPGREKLGLDFSGNTTGMSMTRCSSDTLMISKSSGEDGGSISQNTSGYMDASTLECNHSLGSATTRPLPDQSAFDGPTLADQNHISHTSFSFDPPLFASPSSLRKRRPADTQYTRYAPNSSSSTEGSPENTHAQAYSGSVGRLWGTSGSIGSPQHGIFTDTARPQNIISTSALSSAVPDGLHGTPSAGGIAIPGSVGSIDSSCSGESDILIRVRQGSQTFDASCSGGKTTRSCTGGIDAPFASLSHRVPGLVRQSSLMDAKLLLSQSEDDFEFSRRVNFREDFEEVGLLGSGTFADVYKVRQKHGGVPGAFYAVKKSKRQFRSKRDREWLMAEVRTMKLLGQQSACAYVVPFIRAWQEESYFYVQMGYAERGTLRELLIHLASLPKRSGTSGNNAHSSNNSITCPPVVTDNTVWHIVHDVCAGLQHIHSCGMVHLDIKPANLLITESGTLQIGDFGMAAAIGSCDDGNEGDTRYMAEELLNNTERLPSADMFSLGLTLFEISCFYATATTTNSESTGIEYKDASSLRFTVQRGLPSNGSLWHTLREDSAPPLPQQRGSTLQQLITACMKRDPISRPTAVQVLGMSEVADTLDDVDPVLLCAPRHDDIRGGRAGVPYIARSASMQAIENLVNSDASSSGGQQQGLRVTVGPDNQIDYTALGDGAFTPSFSHGHSSYSPMGNH